MNCQRHILDVKTLLPTSQYAQVWHNYWPSRHQGHCSAKKTGTFW